MRERLERILGELEQRYGLEPRLAERLRPVLARILEPQTPEEARPGLLTLLAETCERQAAVRADCERAAAGFEALFQELARMLQRANGLPETGLPGATSGLEG